MKKNHCKPTTNPFHILMMSSIQESFLIQNIKLPCLKEFVIYTSPFKNKKMETYHNRTEISNIFITCIIKFLRARF